MKHGKKNIKVTNTRNNSIHDNHMSLCVDLGIAYFYREFGLAQPREGLQVLLPKKILFYVTY